MKEWGLGSRVNFPIMAIGMLVLIFGIWAGLLRLSWALPIVQPALPAAHGALMVSGFLGTFISLERAFALRYRWCYAAPLLTGIGALGVIFGSGIGPVLMTLGSLGLVMMFVVILRFQLTLPASLMGLGALSLFVGNGVWLASMGMKDAVPWWAGFLVLTIAGERLELAQLLHISKPKIAAFLVAIFLFILGIFLTLVDYGSGMRAAGAGMLALAVWLLRYDVAKSTVKGAGLTRFTGICLVSSYFWLGVGGVVWLVYGGATGGPYYDAMLHAIFLGFVFSMIFGHAPLIFPVLFGLKMPFSRAFYIHFAFLHASLAMRVAGGMAGLFPLMRLGGLLNAVALTLFLANTMRSIWKGRREKKTVE